MPNHQYLIWTPERPKKPGAYWFAGWTEARHAKYDEPKLYLCRAFHDANKNITIVGGGMFIYKDCLGLWAPAELPDMPTVALNDLKDNANV